MPSDAAKRRQQQKREKRQAADKKRAAATSSEVKLTAKTDSVNDQAASDRHLHVFESDSVRRTVTCQLSEKAFVPVTPKEQITSCSSDSEPSSAKPVVLPKISSKSCAGVLTSHPESRDIHVERLSLTLHGAELLSDARLELNCGQRYGLVGLNGCGEYGCTCNLFLGKEVWSQYYMYMYIDPFNS